MQRIFSLFSQTGLLVGAKRNPISAAVPFSGHGVGFGATLAGDEFTRRNKSPLLDKYIGANGTDEALLPEATRTQPAFWLGTLNPWAISAPIWAKAGLPSIEERRNALKRKYGIHSCLVTPREYENGRGERLRAQKHRFDLAREAVIEVRSLQRRRNALAQSLTKTSDATERDALQWAMKHADQLLRDKPILKLNRAVGSARARVHNTARELFPTLNGLPPTPPGVTLPAISIKLTDFYNPQAWTRGRSKDSHMNARRHYRKHRPEFNPSEHGGKRRMSSIARYRKKIRLMVENPPPGTEMRVMQNGDLQYYDPEANLFVALRYDGTPRTAYCPDGPSRKDAYNVFAYKTHAAGEKPPFDPYTCVRGSDDAGRIIYYPHAPNPYR